MKVTQNTDGSLTVDIPYADIADAVKTTLQRTPILSPTLLNLVTMDLGDAFSTALRAASISLDQAMSDTVVAAVKALAATAAQPVVVGP